MRRADRVGGLVLLALGVGYAATAAARYPYTSQYGPGSGFLPFWLGVTMAVLGTLLLASAARAGTPEEASLPDRAGRVRLVAVVVATAVFIAVLRVTGMAFGTALFLVVLLRAVEGYPWRLALPVAVGAAALNWAVFTYWLQVPFPVGVLGF